MSEVATVSHVEVPISCMATLERVEWSHLRTEDYYVRIGRTMVGIVGYDDSRECWTVSGKCDATTAHFAKRKWGTRDAAVKSLVRYYIRESGVWLNN
jgi:hypothetical protein